MASDSIFLIDIDKILRDKAGRKAKRIPRFFRILSEAYRTSGRDKYISEKCDRQERS